MSPRVRFCSILSCKAHYAEDMQPKFRGWGNVLTYSAVVNDHILCWKKKWKFGVITSAILFQLPALRLPNLRHILAHPLWNQLHCISVIYQTWHNFYKCLIDTTKLLCLKNDSLFARLLYLPQPLIVFNLTMKNVLRNILYWKLYHKNFIWYK